MVNIQCPHCGQVSQIFLSTRASVIVLNCPSCLSPVMHVRRKTFQLDQRCRMKNLKPGSRALLVSRLLEQAGPAAIGTVKHAAVTRVSRAGRGQRTAPYKLSAYRHEERYITEDDCINLRIDLALCADAKEFIRRL